MLQVERQEEILQLLKSHQALRVSQLAKLLYTSEATVRRDLAALERDGSVRRVFGGVVAVQEQLPLDFRRRKDSAAKEEIARRAAELVSDGETVFLDASSTALHLLPYLLKKKELTLVTNSHRVVDQAREGKARVFCTGGELSRRNFAFVGRDAERAVAAFHPDTVFFSSQGVSEDGDITDSSQEETNLRQAAIAAGGRKIFLCDSGKVGKSYLFRLCRVADIDAVVTDGEFPAALLAGKGVTNG